MQLTRRDRVATTFVAIAVLATALWALGVWSDDETTVRVITGVVLALGFAASASAVVPGFAELLHGSRVYLAVTSVLGLVALGAGIAALVSGSGPMLGLLVLATLVLWAVSTVRHVNTAGGTGTHRLGGTAAASR